MAAYFQTNPTFRGANLCPERSIKCYASVPRCQLLCRVFEAGDDPAGLKLVSSAASNALLQPLGGGNFVKAD